MISPPKNEQQLLARASALCGKRLALLAEEIGFPLPADLRHHKGAVGDLLERALGATAGSRPAPDFEEIGVELKTIPLGLNERPRESTHVCSLPAAIGINEHWACSTVRLKLRRVLWVPIASAPHIPLADRRIGRPFIWSPNPFDEAILKRDWEEHMELVATGRFDELDARTGTYLQVRPKTANAKSRVQARDQDGCPTWTLPRGFYLRSSFTARLLRESLLQ